MPAIIEADDDGMYVLKFRGAGQGRKALIAELIAGEMARAAGLPIPEIVLVDLDPDLARTEPDPEIQHLIKASGGINLALDYLPGSVTFDPVVQQPDSELASAIVWFDAYISNVDRTARNTNMLIWHKKLWLIDHGAALYFHHMGDNYVERSGSPFPQIKDHVLLPFANSLPETDGKMTAWFTTPGLIERIVNLIPEDWLTDDSSSKRSAQERRDAYVAYLLKRLESPRAFVEAAIHAR